MISINNKLILEPYSGKREIKQSGESRGFVTIDQKENLVGLKVLLDSNLRVGNQDLELKRGDIVYFLEEILYNSPWSRKIFKSDLLEEPFIIGEGSYAIYVKKAK